MNIIATTTKRRKEYKSVTSTHKGVIGMSHERAIYCSMADGVCFSRSAIAVFMSDV